MPALESLNVLLSCPTCSRTLDAAALDPAARAARCADCGVISPRVSPPRVTSEDVVDREARGRKEWRLAWRRTAESFELTARLDTVSLRRVPRIGLIALCGIFLLVAWFFGWRFGALYVITTAPLIALVVFANTQERRVSLDRSHLRFNGPVPLPFLARSVIPTTAVARFGVNRGGVYRVVAHTTDGNDPSVLASFTREDDAKLAADAFNEALYVVTAPPHDSGPYRA